MYFQRLNPTDEGSQDETRRKGGKNRSRSHANRGEDSRLRERREEKRDGAEKKGSRKEREQVKQ